MLHFLLPPQPLLVLLVVCVACAAGECTGLALAWQGFCLKQIHDQVMKGVLQYIITFHDMP
jgi:hypothetical protein